MGDTKALGEHLGQWKPELFQNDVWNSRVSEKEMLWESSLRYQELPGKATAGAGRHKTCFSRLAVYGGLVKKASRRVVKQMKSSSSSESWRVTVEVYRAVIL